LRNVLVSQGDKTKTINADIIKCFNYSYPSTSFPIEMIFQVYTSSDVYTDATICARDSALKAYKYWSYYPASQKCVRFYDPVSI